jgi:hypothetical protein
MYRIGISLIVSVICVTALACGSGSQPTSPTPPSSAPATKPATSAVGPTATPLGPSGYKVEWLQNQIAPSLEADKEYHFPVTLKNAGNETWPSRGTGGGPVNQVSLSYHWLPAKGDTAVQFEGHRTPLPHDIAPGETFSLQDLLVTTPVPGTYRLQLTLVHEGVTWFEQRGGSTLVLPITVR